jgi:OmpR family response regulator RpaB
MLPEIDGFEVLRRLRKNNNIPVVMLTARGDVMDRIVGLELGADDYLPKPFEPRELVARIQNLLKRSQAGKNDSLNQWKDLIIDQKRQQVILQKKIIELTGTEYELLLLLAKSPGTIFSRDSIINHLRGIDADIYSRAVDILVSRLRNKLKPLDYIHTRRSAGYFFMAPDNE